MSTDIAAERNIAHPRITNIQRSSTDPGIVARVTALAQQATSVLVVLDSDHRAPHVPSELRAYAPLIRRGQYIHVQDGITVETDFSRGKDRPGLVAAVREFLRESPAFERAVEVEHRYMMTAHPYCWLKRRD